MAKIDVVHDLEGDWEAVYIDGESVAQNHSVDWAYLLKTHLLGKTIESISIWETDLSDLGWGPSSLSDFEEGALTAI